MLGGPHARCYPEDSAKYFDYVLGFTDKALVDEVIREREPAKALGKILSAAAQPVSFDPEAPPPALIPFKAERGMGEHVGRAQGVAGPDGKRLYLKGLDVMSPLTIRVFAKDESKPIDVSLHRFFWNEAERSGRTDRNGDWQYAGRVHAEVGIELRAAEPSEFYVLAWMGPSLEPDFGANLFVSPDAVDGGPAVEAEERTASGGSGMARPTPSTCFSSSGTGPGRAPGSRPRCASGPPRRRWRRLRWRSMTERNG